MLNLWRTSEIQDGNGSSGLGSIDWEEDTKEGTWGGADDETEKRRDEATGRQEEHCQTDKESEALRERPIQDKLMIKLITFILAKKQKETIKQILIKISIILWWTHDKLRPSRRKCIIYKESIPINILHHYGWDRH